MEDFLLVVVLILLTVRWFVLSGRMQEMQRRIDALAHVSRGLEAMVQELRAERAAAAQPAPPPLPVPEAAHVPPPPLSRPLPVPETVHVAPLAPPPLPVPTSAPLPPPFTAPPPVAVPPPIPYFPREPAPEFAQATSAGQEAYSTAKPGPTLSERMREKMRGEEWEAIVGGSWLNKAGVFLLVVGVASLIVLGLNSWGPVGRVMLGLSVSFAMLIGGFLLEKRVLYRIIGRGLLGGGWAALYFTTYAMQAVDAAKVIYNPLLGGLLLLAVAAGMIVHSLKYRSQTVAGLAYFVAFVTLGPWITPETTLAVIALVPLAASLLYIAYRFEWSELAIFGLVATYGTCASRGDSGAPLWSAQTIFSIYWLLFEVFDLLRASRRSNRPAERAILPLNALAFVGLSYAKWSSAAPQHLYTLAAGIAAVYFLSTLIRTRLRPPSSFAPEADTVARIFAGGYEGPITLTAILSAAAVFLKFHGGWANAGLLAEAELLFVAGLLFREAYPRRLAAAVFATFVGKLLFVDLSSQSKITVSGWSVRSWTPSAALAGLLFYINRALRTTDKVYGYAASAVFALIVGFETPERFLGLAWFSLATLLFGFGWQRRLLDFRIQGYSVAALGAIAVAIHEADVAAGYATRSPHPWVALLSAAVLMYAAVLCALRSAADRLSDDEREALRSVASWASSAALMALVWRILPGEYLGLGWMALALPVLELGLRRWPPDFRMQAYVIAAVGALRVLFFNVFPVQNDGPLLPRLAIAGSALVAYLIATRVYIAEWHRSSDLRKPVVNISSATGTLFVLVALWALLPAVAVGPAWAVVALLLLEAGFIVDLPGVRTQGHVAAAAAVTRLFLANFDVLGNTAGISHRLLSVLPVIVCHYYQWSRQRDGSEQLRQWERGIGRAYLYSAAALMIVLLRFELGRSLTVVGWSLFALALVALGQRWNNVDLRWQSYAIAALTFFRSWTTDFWSPGTLEGTGGRVATGAFVIACFFVSQLLIPQSRKDRTGLERHARLYYSLLATVLLTILLFHEVSGRLLTMAWGAEGLLLLTVGFPLRDRILRLSGLTLFLVCILKLFVYDLRQLETLYRILSFIVLGLILLSVSWVYTRFRSHIQRYL